MCKLIIFTVLLLYFSTQQGFGLDAANIKYFLYTTTNPNVAVELKVDDNSTWHLINPEVPIKVLCHGLNDDSNAFWYAPSKDAFIAKEGVNVIFVDWSKYANTLYPIAVAIAQAVGDTIAELLIKLSQTQNIPYSRFHLIGHSLGAHVMGFSGKHIYNREGEKVGRITALDPAGPLFNGAPDSLRLSKEDALFVDAIHTSTLLQGYKISIGHADFWPNGGIVQKGCSDSILDNCSHLKAPMYFQESINSTAFAAWKCGSYQDFNDGKCFGNEQVVMGENADPTYRGNFYLNTNENSPYAIPTY